MRYRSRRIGWPLLPIDLPDVIPADGSRMKLPSEERMHSIFCAAGEPGQVEQVEEAECDEE
jgi:hypothetical protein